MHKPFWKALGNYDVEEDSNWYTIKDSGESLTVQSMAEEADINVLMKRFGLLGTMPQNPRLPEYGDYDSVTDFQSAMNAVVAGERAFMEFPPEVRSRFANDPQKFLEFCATPGNEDEGVRLGLWKRKVDNPKKDDIIAPRVEVPPKE